MTVLITIIYNNHSYVNINNCRVKSQYIGAADNMDFNNLYYIFIKLCDVTKKNQLSFLATIFVLTAKIRSQISINCIFKTKNQRLKNCSVKITITH